MCRTMFVTFVVVRRSQRNSVVVPTCVQFFGVDCTGLDQPTQGALPVLESKVARLLTRTVNLTLAVLPPTNWNGCRSVIDFDGLWK